MILTNEMEKGTYIENLGPSQARLCKPAHQYRRESAGSNKAQVNDGRLVVVISQLDSAEEDHIADDAKEGEALTQLHQQHTDNHLQLLACVTGLAVWQGHPARPPGRGHPPQEVSLLQPGHVHSNHAAAAA